jgi:hypothetical protein
MIAMARLYAPAPGFARTAVVLESGDLAVARDEMSGQCRRVCESARVGGVAGQGRVLELWLHDIDVSFTVAQHG